MDRRVLPGNTGSKRSCDVSLPKDIVSFTGKEYDETVDLLVKIHGAQKSRWRKVKHHKSKGVCWTEKYVEGGRPVQDEWPVIGGGYRGGDFGREGKNRNPKKRDFRKPRRKRISVTRVK